jgi:glycosyltransferase involved in cell wall biosynthesis
MKIDLYAFIYNDEDILPFFLDYYSPIADRITFIENGSTDRTVEILKAAQKKAKPIIKIFYSGMKTWDWDESMVLRNAIWQATNYDLVMWCDMDEVIYHKNLRKFLETNDYAIYQMKGYEMVSTRLPKEGTSLLDIKMGTHSYLLDKFLIWKKDANIKFTDAHHIADTNEDICSGEILLLHYKYLGVDIMVKRAEAIKARVPAESYCKGIKGNILKVFPGFVKTRQMYIAEIADRVSLAEKII